MALTITLPMTEQVYWHVLHVGHRTITGVVQEAIAEHGEDIRLMILVHQVHQGIDLDYELHMARHLYRNSKVDIQVFRWVNPKDELWQHIEDEAAKRAKGS